MSYFRRRHIWAFSRHLWRGGGEGSEIDNQKANDYRVFGSVGPLNERHTMRACKFSHDVWNGGGDTLPFRRLMSSSSDRWAK